MDSNNDVRDKLVEAEGFSNGAVVHDLSDLDVTVADSWPLRSWGWRLRSDVSGECLMIPFDSLGASRTVGMFGVWTDLDVLWCHGHKILAARTLPGMWGHWSEPGSCILELPPGTIEERGIKPGDTVEVRA